MSESRRENSKCLLPEAIGSSVWPPLPMEVHASEKPVVILVCKTVSGQLYENEFNLAEIRDE